MKSAIIAFKYGCLECEIYMATLSRERGSCDPMGYKAQHHNYRKKTTSKHRNRKPLKFFYHSRRRANDDNIAQHGGETQANTKSYSLGLQRTSLILETHVMLN